MSEESIWIEIAFQRGDSHIQLPNNRILDFKSKTLIISNEDNQNKNKPTTLKTEVRRGIWFYQIQLNTSQFQGKDCWIPFREDDCSILESTYNLYLEQLQDTKNELIKFNDPNFPIQNLLFIDFKNMTLKEEDNNETISINRGYPLFSLNRDPIGKCSVHLYLWFIVGFFSSVLYEFNYPFIHKF